MLVMTMPPVMCTEYCDCVLAALHARYCDCCAMSLWHQVFPVLCIVYCVPGIRSVVYWVLGLSYIVLGHWVLGPCALDVASRATANVCILSFFHCRIVKGFPEGDGGYSEFLFSLPRFAEDEVSKRRCSS